MARVLPYVLMFLVCFGGVYTAVEVQNWRENGRTPAASLEAAINAQPVKYTKEGDSTSFTTAAHRLLPAVVSIDSLSSNPWDPFGREQVAGEGSGVIISQDGYVVTNNHVVEGAQSVIVHVMGGKQYKAKVIGSDSFTDLALLKVDARGLPAAELGDSDSLDIGEWVIAVGNPLGYEGTLSVGVVSALNRDLPGTAVIGAIQTDAAINQGNSGGALANIHGQVVGINTMIATPNRGSVGIGFAIPASRVKKAVADFMKFGRVRHPDLGIARIAPSWVLGQPRFADEVGSNPPEQGILIRDVVPGSPLANAGVGSWDVLTEIDGKPMKTGADYLDYLRKATLGQTARIKFWQKGAYKTATVQLAEVIR
jgi:serine protease Do